MAVSAKQIQVVLSFSRIIAVEWGYFSGIQQTEVVLLVDSLHTPLRMGAIIYINPVSEHLSTTDLTPNKTVTIRYNLRKLNAVNANYGGSLPVHDANVIY